ncbi:MAG: hypothetical protein ABEI97_00850 [Candidatus Nanohaloarchaea archaeon]
MVLLAIAIITALFLITVPKGQAENATQRGQGAVDNASGAGQVSGEGAIINPGFEVSGQNGWTCFGDAARQGPPNQCVYFPSSSYSPPVEPQEGRNVGYVAHDQGACGIHGFAQRVVVPEQQTTLSFSLRTSLNTNREAGVYVLDSDGNLIAEAIHSRKDSSIPAPTDWTEETIDLSGHAGEEVQIIVGNAETADNCDESGRYQVWVDDFGFGIDGG